MEKSATLFILLIISHVITDFFFQSDSIVASKNGKQWKSTGLYMHALCAGLFCYIAFLIIKDWEQWLIPTIVTVSHFFIDWGKTYFKNKSIAKFVIDQLLHILVIVICWITYTAQTDIIITLLSALQQQNTLLIILAFLLVVKPAGIFIKTILDYVNGIQGERWNNYIEQLISGKQGLEKAGRWIGYLERILILCFILLKYYEGIGFLLAAKSIFRFGELTKIQERAYTEYILIGTLLSFTIALFIGLIIH